MFPPVQEWLNATFGSIKIEEKNPWLIIVNTYTYNQYIICWWSYISGTWCLRYTISLPNAYMVKSVANK